MSDHNETAGRLAADYRADIDGQRAMYGISTAVDAALDRQTIYGIDPAPGTVVSGGIRWIMDEALLSISDYRLGDRRTDPLRGPGAYWELDWHLHLPSHWSDRPLRPDTVRAADPTSAEARCPAPQAEDRRAGDQAHSVRSRPGKQARSAAPYSGPSMPTLLFAGGALLLWLRSRKTLSLGASNTPSVAGRGGVASLSPDGTRPTPDSEAAVMSSAA